METVAGLGAGSEWRDGTRATADWIDCALNGDPECLPLDGKAAEATYWALRLMVGIGFAPDPDGATGLRDALRAHLGY